MNIPLLLIGAAVPIFFIVIAFAAGSQRSNTDPKFIPFKGNK